MENVSDENYRIVLSEVYDILSFLDQSELNKISTNFINFIKKNKSETYITNISPYLPLEMQNLKEETKDVIAFIYRKYMCSEEEKIEFKKKDNQEILQLEAKKRELYNPDDLFKNKRNNLSNNNHNENLSIEENKTTSKNMLIAKENFVQRIINKIKATIAKLFRH